MRAPAFWRRDGLAARLLAPAGTLYDALGRARWAMTTSEVAPLPVLCVGNATVGGTGKTPIVLDLLRRLRRRGVDAHGLCRGHGGRVGQIVRVDPARHDAGDVGDEALLLAEVAPTWAGRDRLAGARAAAAAGAEIIVLDDGLQYPRLAKTWSLLVIDAAVGFGNGRVVPAGSLREASSRALDRADAAVLVGSEGAAGVHLPARLRPAWRCDLRPAPGSAALAGVRYLAFAGIGRPEKFFRTARGLGAELLDTRAFADHHRFRLRELEALGADAAKLGGKLLTTSKDRARIPDGWRSRVEVLEIEVAWNDEGVVERWLDRRLGG